MQVSLLGIGILICLGFDMSYAELSFLAIVHAYQILFFYTDTRFGCSRPTSISSMDIWLDLECLLTFVNE